LQGFAEVQAAKNAARQAQLASSGTREKSEANDILTKIIAGLKQEQANLPQGLDSKVYDNAISDVQNVNADQFINKGSAQDLNFAQSLSPEEILKYNQYADLLGLILSDPEAAPNIQEADLGAGAYESAIQAIIDRALGDTRSKTGQINSSVNAGLERAMAPQGGVQNAGNAGGIDSSLGAIIAANKAQSAPAQQAYESGPRVAISPQQSVANYQPGVVMPPQTLPAAPIITDPSVSESIRKSLAKLFGNMSFGSI